MCLIAVSRFTTTNHFTEVSSCTAHVALFYLCSFCNIGSSIMHHVLPMIFILPLITGKGKAQDSQRMWLHDPRMRL